MRKLIIGLLLPALLVSTLAASAFGQDAKAKAEEILKQARAGIGSESTFKNLQTLSSEGTIRRNFGQNQIESQLELEMMLPDKIKLSEISQRGTQIRGFDGTKTWND